MTAAADGGAGVRAKCRMAALAVAVGCACVAAQGQAPPAAPPGQPAASALPAAPPDTRLPGTDPRQCGTSKHAAICAAGRWTRFARIEVRAKAGAFEGVYALEQARDGGIHATYAETSGKYRRGGEVVFVGDSAFAYRTREKFDRSDEILDRMMHSPLMIAQLTAVLLDQGALVGPGEITQNTRVAAASGTQFLRAGLPHTAALYGPPWRLSGDIAPTGDGRLGFSLRLSYRPVDQTGRAQAGKTDTLQLAGTLSFAEQRAKLPDSLDLVGWKVVHNGADAPGASTLGDAREAVGAR